MADLQESIARLQAACRDPRAQMDRYLAQGKKVVGCFAPWAPEELVHASGMIPMGMWGGHTELKSAKSYLPAFACSIMQANMEFGLNGAYEGMSAVIIPAICDTLRCMTQNWRFGVKSIPAIAIVYPQNRRSPASTDYLISEYEGVLLQLAALTGCMMSEAALCETIRIYNEHNRTMREFAAAAAEHLDVITPQVRHAVFKSAFFFEKSEHTAIVQDIIAGLKALPACQWSGKKVVLTGIMCEPEQVLDILADNGIAVAADDLVQESQQFRADTPETGGGGLKRLALQWNERYGCSLIHELGKPRGGELAKLCAGVGADGVINCMVKFCDPEEYDQPWLEKDLRAAGIPCASIEIDQQNASFEQIRTRVQTFCELL